MNQISRASSVVFALFLVWLGSTSSSFATNNEAVAKVIQVFFEKKEARTFSEAIARNIETIKKFYESRNYKPVWTRDTGPKGKGKALFEELNRSTIHGLKSEFYNVGEMRPLMKETGSKSLAQLDMMLSGAFINYAHDLRNGRVANHSQYENHRVAPVQFEASDLISDAADAGNLRDLASEFLGTDERYVRLISKYVEFGRISNSNFWPKIDPEGSPIKNGQKDDRMNDIRTLLLLTGDLPQSVSVGEPVHDANTYRAVLAYQARLGLDRTGELDATTLRAMATPLTERMRQILVNLERRRWQNRGLGDNHIYINLADERARIVLDGKTAGFVSLNIGAAKKSMPTFYASVPRVLATENGLSFELVPQDPADGPPLLVPADTIESQEALGYLEPHLSQPDQTGMREFKKPLLGYVTYLTAWANKDGSINFRPDTLLRDEKVAKLLELD